MHLRVAERVKCLFDNLDETAFYIGSIAPDSGRMVDDFTYLPPKDVSHWKRENVSYEQRFLDNHEFYLKYCKNERDNFKRSLCLGYYVHILVDTIFVRDIIHPYMAKHGYPFWQANIKKIRKGWYEIDFRYLAKNQPYRPYEMLKTVPPFDNSFISYFASDDFYNRVVDTINLYDNAKVDMDCEFFTHTDAEADLLETRMVNEVTEIIKNI